MNRLQIESASAIGGIIRAGSIVRQVIRGHVIRYTVRFLYVPRGGKRVPEPKAELERCDGWSGTYHIAARRLEVCDQ